MWLVFQGNNEGQRRYEIINIPRDFCPYQCTSPWACPHTVAVFKPRGLQQLIFCTRFRNHLISGMDFQISGMISWFPIDFYIIYVWEMISWFLLCFLDFYCDFLISNWLSLGACTRVTVVVLCVCVSVYLCVCVCVCYRASGYIPTSYVQSEVAYSFL